MHEDEIICVRSQLPDEIYINVYIYMRPMTDCIVSSINVVVNVLLCINLRSSVWIDLYSPRRDIYIYKGYISMRN